MVEAGFPGKPSPKRPQQHLVQSARVVRNRKIPRADSLAKLACPSCEFRGADMDLAAFDCEAHSVARQEERKQLSIRGYVFYEGGRAVGHDAARGGEPPWLHLGPDYGEFRVLRGQRR